MTSPCGAVNHGGGQAGVAGVTCDTPLRSICDVFFNTFMCFDFSPMCEKYEATCNTCNTFGTIGFTTRSDVQHTCHTCTTPCQLPWLAVGLSAIPV